MIDQIFFLPHGMQIIPGAEPTRPEIFEKLNEEMVRITSEFDEKTSHCIVITPHGYNLAEKLVVYYHDKFQGKLYEISPDSVVYGKSIDDLHFTGDLEFTDQLVGAIDLNPEKLVHGSPTYPMTLNWGTTVPLYYFRDHQDLKISILGIPRIRHDNLPRLEEEMKTLARNILQFAEEREEKIALLVSGDLSHVHREDGPYGYHESCTEFDELVQKWFRNSKSSYMERIIELQPTALACGMAGMMLIQEICENQNCTPITSFYDVPTYFGMGIGYWKL